MVSYHKKFHRIPQLPVMVAINSIQNGWFPFAAVYQVSVSEHFKMYIRNVENYLKFKCSLIKRMSMSTFHWSMVGPRRIMSTTST